MSDSERDLTPDEEMGSKIIATDNDPETPQNATEEKALAILEALAKHPSLAVIADPVAFPDITGASDSVLDAMVPDAEKYDNGEQIDRYLGVTLLTLIYHAGELKKSYAARVEAVNEIICKASSQGALEALREELTASKSPDAALYEGTAWLSDKRLIAAVKTKCEECLAACEQADLLRRHGENGVLEYCAENDYDYLFAFERKTPDEKEDDPLELLHIVKWRTPNAMNDRMIEAIARILPSCYVAFPALFRYHSNPSKAEEVYQKALAERAATRHAHPKLTRDIFDVSALESFEKVKRAKGARGSREANSDRNANTARSTSAARNATTQSAGTQKNATSQTTAPASGRKAKKEVNKWVFCFLALFLGHIGLHWFVAKKHIFGVLRLVLLVAVALSNNGGLTALFMLLNVFDFVVGLLKRRNSRGYIEF